MGSRGRLPHKAILQQQSNQLYHPVLGNHAFDIVHGEAG
jgi:hypothetical protein